MSTSKKVSPTIQDITGASAISRSNRNPLEFRETPNYRWITADSQETAETFISNKKLKVESESIKYGFDINGKTIGDKQLKIAVKSGKPLYVSYAMADVNEIEL